MYMPVNDNVYTLYLPRGKTANLRSRETDLVVRNQRTSGEVGSATNSHGSKEVGNLFPRRFRPRGQCVPPSFLDQGPDRSNNRNLQTQRTDRASSSPSSFSLQS